MLELKSEEQADGQGDVIALEGDLDSFTAPRLREVLFGLIDKGARDIILDCRLLNHVDSSGLGTLVGALKQSSGGTGTLSLTGLNRSVRRVLQITGLDTLFPIYLTVTEARNANALVRVT